MTLPAVQELTRRILGGFKPPPKLRLSQYADQPATVDGGAVMDADDVAAEGGWTVKGKAWKAAQPGHPAPAPAPTPASAHQKPADFPQIQGGPQILDEASLQVLREAVALLEPDLPADDVVKWLMENPLARVSEIQRHWRLNYARGVMLSDVWQKHREALTVSESPSLPVSSSSFDEERWRAVLARLMGRKEAVMQDGLWKPLVMVVRELAVTEMPADVVTKVDEVLALDESSSRQGLRHVMAWLMATANHWGMEVPLAEVEEGLGVERKD